MYHRHDITLSDNLMIISGGTFCGKPAFLTLYVSDNFAETVFGIVTEKE